MKFFSIRLWLCFQCRPPHTKCNALSGLPISSWSVILVNSNCRGCFVAALCVSNLKMMKFIMYLSVVLILTCNKVNMWNLVYVNVCAKKFDFLKEHDLILLLLAFWLTITLSSGVLWQASFHLMSKKSCTTWDDYLFPYIKVNNYGRPWFVLNESRSKVLYSSFERTFFSSPLVSERL